MDRFDFSIQDVQDLSKSTNYVMLQAGKGKKDNSSIYIKAIEFSYIEGIIWDNFREYEIKSKMKISSHDWERILNGFQDGINDLSTFKTGDDIKKFLRFGIFSPRNPLNDILNETDEIKGLISNVHNWASKWTQSEKQILIIKNHL